MKKNTVLFFIGLFFFSMFILSEEVEAQTYYRFFYDPMNTTEGWTVSGGGTLTANQSGTTFVSTGTSRNSAMKSYPNFFFGLNLNITMLSYLGASNLLVNYTARPIFPRTTCGSGCNLTQAVGIYLNASTSRMGAFFFDNATDNFVVSSGTLLGTVTAGAWENRFYNFSHYLNYTSLRSNVSTSLFDGTQRNFTTLSNVPFSALRRVLIINLTINADNIAGSNAGIEVGAIAMYADFDADYGNSGNPYTNFTNNQQFSVAKVIAINVTAPIVVNGSYILNGAPAVNLFNNSRYFNSTLTGAAMGWNNVTFNFTFIKNGTILSTYETYSFFLDVVDFYKFFSQVGTVVHSGSNGRTISQIPQFFFNAPLNRSNLALLGATHFVINYTGQISAGANCAGACTVVQEGGVIFHPGGDLNQISFNDGASDILYAECNTDSANMQTGFTTNAYNASMVINFTTQVTNVTTYRADTGAEIAKLSCPFIMESATEETLNLTASVDASGTSPSGKGFTLSNVIFWADFDADYWKSGFNYSTFVGGGSYFTNKNFIPINISAPIIVNATYSLNNGTTTTLCTNCQNATINITGARDGRNNITVNFTFIKSATTFSTDESYSFFAGNAYAACEDSITSIDQPVFNVTFLKETDPTTTVNSNFTLTIVDPSTGANVFQTSRNNKNFFDVCFVNDNITKNVQYTLTYKSTDGTYAERTIGTGASTININRTKPYSTDAYLLATADATTITFTIKDSLAVVQPNLRLEVYRYNSVNNSLILVDTDTSDLNGVVQFSLQLNQQYKFLVKQLNGALLHDTGIFIVAASSYTITLGSTGSGVIRNVIASLGINFNLTCEPGGHSFCNRTLHTHFNATWSALSGVITQACLQIENKTDPFYFGIINTTCTAADNGNIRYDFSPFKIENRTKLSAIFYVIMANSTSTTTPVRLQLASLDIDLFAEYLIWGFVGLFVALIILFTIIGGIAVHSPILTVTSGMVGVFLLYLTGVIALTWLMMMSIVWIGAVVLFFMREAN